MLDQWRKATTEPRPWWRSSSFLTDFCLAALRKMPGVTVPEPEGAFHLFPRIAGLTDSFGFCRQLLEETRVGIAPGVAFGEGGEGSVRICYAAERQILEQAMARLSAFMQAR